MQRNRKSMDFPRAPVPVRCGGLRGTMLWDDGTVLFKKEGDEALLTGKQFEILAGKGANKKW
ncbi:hypothetical protein DUNSADRAFT_16976 [Dunaliella salina]|uniref:Encoded protein n=1 Tax=Dunaliella salina TaxID=3046 RepID=A0ABQ7G2M2_DUNSA|nr:hypothetical protein DUNSADRAFT_16976 [Dunaliella salina]|eukprot:KAF5828857.1 hypothetical protein DUNSADRAFT_16976 [Dunaliella salina]